MKVYVVALCMLSLAASEKRRFFNRGFQNTNSQFLGSDSSPESVVLFLNEHLSQQERPSIRPPKHLMSHNRPPLNSYYNHRVQDKPVFGRSSFNYAMSIPPPLMPQHMRKSKPLRLQSHVLNADLATVVIPNSLQLHTVGNLRKPQSPRITLKGHQRMPEHGRPIRNNVRQQRKPTINIQIQQRPSNENGINKENSGVNVRYIQQNSHGSQDESREPIAYITVEHQIAQTSKQQDSRETSSNEAQQASKQGNSHSIQVPSQKTQKPHETAISISSQGSTSSGVSHHNPPSQVKPRPQQQQQIPTTTLSPLPVQYTTLPPNTMPSVVQPASSLASSTSIRAAGPTYGSSQTVNMRQPGSSPNFPTTYINNGNVPPNSVITSLHKYQPSTQQNAPINFASSQHSQSSYLPTSSVGQITYVASADSPSLTAQNGYAISSQSRPSSPYVQQPAQISYLHASQPQATVPAQTVQQPNYISYVQGTQGSYVTSQAGEAPVQTYGQSVQTPYTSQTNQVNYAPTLQLDQTNYPSSPIRHSSYDAVQQQQNDQAYILNSHVKNYASQPQANQASHQTHITQQAFPSPQEALRAAYTQHEAAQTSYTAQNQPSYILSSSNNQGNYGTNVQLNSYTLSNPTGTQQVYAINSQTAQKPAPNQNIEGTYLDESPSQIETSSQNGDQTSYILRQPSQQHSEDLAYAPSNSQQKSQSIALSPSGKYISILASNAEQKANSAAANYADGTITYNVPSSHGSYTSTGILTPGSTYGKGLQKYNNDQFPAYQPQATTEDKTETEEEFEEEEGEDAATYKVVYIPLDILKNILSNSVDSTSS